MITVTSAFDSTKPDGTPRKLMDVARLNSLGRQAQTAFRQALTHAHQDFLEIISRA